jgi:tetratricopeptide (TPR) repeat protein
MRSLSGASLAFGAVLALGSFATSVGCAKVGEIQSRKAFKSGNAAYQQQDYKKASEYYEETIAAAPETPTARQALFFLGNSYDNLYKPSKKGEAANDALLTKAVDNYQKAAEKLSASADPADKKLGKLSLEYLVASYGAEKLNDPAKAEPVVQRMIQLEPGEPTNYFALAKIYEDAGAYEEAEKMLVQAKAAKPGDPAVYMTLAGYYNRQGQFDKTIEALEERATKEPNNPEAFYTIATYYWDEAYRDFKLKEAEKKAFVQKGVEAVDHALQIKPDYMEALVYKNLLLRLEANMEKDPKKQADLLKEADRLRDRAQELRKAKVAGSAP